MAQSSSLKTRKSKLREKSQQLKSAISRDFKELKANSREIGTAGLIIVGVVAAGFITYKLLSSGSNDEEDNNVIHLDGNTGTKVVYVNANKENTLFNEIMRNIASFLLGIAKQKLLEYLEERKSKSE